MGVSVCHVSAYVMGMSVYICVCVVGVCMLCVYVMRHSWVWLYFCVSVCICGCVIGRDCIRESRSELVSMVVLE